MSSKQPKQRQPHKVTVLAYDGLCVFEFGIVTEIFGLHRPELGPPLYDLNISAIETAVLKMQGGLTLNAPVNLKAFEQADTIIIPGWRGAKEDVPNEIIDVLQKAHKAGTRLLSICSGIYVLAEAGLLGGRHATTHWRYIQDFSGRFPEVQIDPDALYLQDETIITSAGSSAGIDACLHVVRQDYGAAIANNFARRLVMHAHREGGQAQFIERPIPIDKTADQLSNLIVRIESDLAQPWTIDTMVAETGMSKRTFQRKFVALTGTSPSRWLTFQRVDAAREALETTHSTLDSIAHETGFSDTDALRYHFQAKLGVSPGVYRKRFFAA